MSFFAFSSPKKPFNKQEITTFINSLPNVLQFEEPEHKNTFILAGHHYESIKKPVSHKRFEEKEEPLWTCPQIWLSDELVEVGVNWSDTVENDLRKFCLYILDNYECTGVDHDAYKYSTNNECMDWINEWLLERSGSK